MSKELNGRNGKTVGTQEYLDAINKNVGIGVWMTHGANSGYTAACATVGQQIARVLHELHTDLHQNEDSLSMLPERDRNTTLQMVKEMKVVVTRLYKPSSDADACVKLLELRGGSTNSRCSSALEKQIVAKIQMILKDNRSGVSSNDRIRLAEQLMRDNGKYRPGKGDKKDVFLAALAEGKHLDKNFWREVLRQVEYERKPGAVTGRCGKVLCSDAYNTHLEKMAFDNVISGGNKTYMVQIIQLFCDIIDIIKRDVTAGIGTDDYVIYENRERLKAVAKELGKYATVPSGFDADVEKLRRLEHFDNKVIVLKKDTDLPVSAELKWIKGQNILLIYANIRFIKMRGQTNTEARKKAALEGFHKWEGSYMVFSGQPVELKLNLNIKSPDMEVDGWGEALKNLTHGCNNIALIEKKDSLRLIDAGKIIHNMAFQRSFAFRKKDMNKKNIMAIQEPMWKENPMMHSLWEEIPDEYYPDEVNLMGLGYTLPNDADQGVAVAKHEFGHILGLGDMYVDEDNFPFLEMEGIEVSDNPNDTTTDGVLKKYPDLASYYNGKREFDSVMYWNTTIHNNDIEMVIEAFRTGKRQNFQKQGLFGDEISTVLGKGN